MILLLPPTITSTIVDALSQAGRREIGGVLMGEHIDADTFRIKELTVQRRGGTFAAFVRLVEEIITPMRKFFAATRHDYTRFNYIGEWHSHHSFSLEPSGRDHSTMLQIITDPQLGARFVVLMLVRLNDANKLEGSVTVYFPNKSALGGSFLLEGESEKQTHA